MANFTAVTASNGAKVKDVEAARRALEGFHLLMEESALEVTKDGCLRLYGYDWFDLVPNPTALPADLVAAFRVENGRDPNDWRDLWASAYDLKEWQQENGIPTSVEALAKAIAPHLEEDWIIQSVGNERCRFPLGATQWTIKPDGTLLARGLGE